MGRRSSVLIASCFALLFVASRVRGQEGPPPEPALKVPYHTRWLLDLSIGTQASLGFKPPSTSFGAGFERPVSKAVEIQGSGWFSPDKKYITNDGHSVGVSLTGIYWASRRLGIVGTIVGSSLHTSQFTKNGVHSSAGIVLRNGYFGPARFYFSYLIPAGCVWATAGNPCKIQSNRTQGPQWRVEGRLLSHMRLGGYGGVYHFCDQGNPYQPQAGRTCHWGTIAMTTLRLEFPGDNADKKF